MFQPILACGWCGGVIEMFIGTIVGSILFTFGPVIINLLSFFKNEKSCNCVVSSQIENRET